MKLRNKIVTGLFKYVPGITYTYGDLILSNNILYSVKVDEWQADIEESDLPKSDKLENYVKTLSYSESNSDEDTTIVTPAAFRLILTQYFKGLKSDGSLESIRVLSNTTEPNPDLLEDYLHNGAYQVEVPDHGYFNIPTGRYLLRVYKAGDTVHQEIFSDEGYCYIRQYNGKSWNSWSMLSGPHHVSKLTSKLKELEDISKSYNDTCKKLIDRELSLSKVTFTSKEENEVNVYTVNEDIKENFVIHVIITDTRDNQTIQYSTNFYTTDITSTKSRVIEMYQGDKVLVNLSFIKGKATITIPNNLTLSYIYISRGRL